MSYLFQNSEHRQMIENLNIHHHNMAVEKMAADVHRRMKERRVEIRLNELTKGSSKKLLWSEGKRGRGNLPRLHRMRKPARPSSEDRDRALRMMTARAEDKLQRHTLRDRRALIGQWSQQKKATTPGPETASTTLQEEKPPLRPHSTMLVRPGKDVIIDRIMPSGKTLRSQWGVAPRTTFSSRAIVTEVTLGSGPHVEAFSP